MVVLSASSGTRADRLLVRESLSLVYFIEAVGLDLVKIGYAIDLQKRFTGMMTTSPAPLTLLGVLDGGPKLECALHEQLAAHRAHGEWFRKTPEVMAVVATARPSAGQQFLNQTAKIRGAALQVYLAKMKRGEVIRPTRGKLKHPKPKRDYPARYDGL